MHATLIDMIHDHHIKKKLAIAIYYRACSVLTLSRKRLPDRTIMVHADMAISDNVIAIHGHACMWLHSAVLCRENQNKAHMTAWNKCL